MIELRPLDKSEERLSALPELEADEETDGVAFLNEILGGASVDEGDFSREWTEVFGEPDDGAAWGPPAEGRRPESSFFLPSHLLDQNGQQSSLSGQNVHKTPPKNFCCQDMKLYVSERVHLRLPTTKNI